MMDDPVLVRAASLVRLGDLSTLTFNSIMAQLVKEFGDDIKPKKAQIRQAVNSIIEEMNADSDSSDDDEESSDEESSAAEAVDTRVSKKKSCGTSWQENPKRPSNSGIQKAVGISRPLAKFLGLEYVGDSEIGGAVMSRTQTTKFLNQYIKSHNLQSEKDKRNIICDEPMRALLGVDVVTFFSLQKALSPHFEKSSKPPRVPKSTTEKGPSAFHKPLMMSPSLQNLISSSEPVSRPQIVKKIWDYIKGHELQDPKDRRFILCDEKLYAVFKTKRLHMMKLPKILSEHLLTDEPEENEITNEQDETQSKKSKVDVVHDDIDRKPNVVKQESIPEADTTNIDDHFCEENPKVKKESKQELLGTRSWSRNKFIQ